MLIVSVKRFSLVIVRRIDLIFVIISSVRIACC